MRDINIHIFSTVLKTESFIVFFFFFIKFSYKALTVFELNYNYLKELYCVFENFIKILFFRNNRDNKSESTY